MTAVQHDGPYLSVQGNGGYLQDVLDVLSARGIRVRDLRAASPSLEDVFLNLSGRAMRTPENA